MKKIVFAFAIFLSLSYSKAQQIWSEDFQSYNGFGETPTGWTTTIGGFNVKLRTLKFNPDSNAKFVEAILSNNRKRDSLITPSFGPITANTILTFRSRLVDSYTGIFATFNHLPVAGDFVSAYISTDGGTSYQLLQNLLPGYPSSGNSLVFNNFSIPLGAYEGQNAKVKFLTKLTTGNYYPGFDDFKVSGTTSTKNLKSTQEINLYPNPSNGQVLLTAPGFSNKAQVEVFNILGSKVHSGNINNEKSNLDLSELKSGVYLVKVSEGKQVAVSRLILK